jgi:hypothetical protein
MYIFSRTITLNRHKLMEATGAAVEVAAMVSDIGGLPVSVFATRYGETLNTLMWSARVESQTELQGVTDKLIANADYLQWITTHSELFESAPLDRLASVVASSLMEGPKRFYNVLTATAANGRMGDAVAFGIKAQQFVSDALGLPTAFLVPVYGPFGAVVWLTGADSMSHLDGAVEMQMTNPDYHTLVAEAGPLFVESSGVTGLIEKVN